MTVYQRLNQLLSYILRCLRSTRTRYVRLFELSGIVSESDTVCWLPSAQPQLLHYWHRQLLLYGHLSRIWPTSLEICIVFLCVWCHVYYGVKVNHWLVQHNNNLSGAIWCHYDYVYSRYTSQQRYQIKNEWSPKSQLYANIGMVHIHLQQTLINTTSFSRISYYGAIQVLRNADGGKQPMSHFQLEKTLRWINMHRIIMSCMQKKRMV